MHHVNASHHLFDVVPSSQILFLFLFFFYHLSTTEIYTLSLHDALPIWFRNIYYKRCRYNHDCNNGCCSNGCRRRRFDGNISKSNIDRKSTRLNSSHRCISYAVFCLKKKKKKEI